MELKPAFKIEVNGSDVSATIEKNLSSLSLKDEYGAMSDELTIEVSGTFGRPKYGDEIKIWLGYKGKSFSYMGTFKVQNTSLQSGNSLKISASGADFGGNIKVKKCKEFKDTSICSVVSEIASHYKMDSKCDTEIEISYVAQSNESDMAFLKRLSELYNLIFSIKDNKFLMLNKGVEDKPTYSLRASELYSYEIRHSDKTLYRSVEVTYRDSKENSDNVVTIGDCEPMLRFEGSFKSEEAAKIAASARLDIANRGSISGSLTCAGGAIFAGGILKLAGTIEDNREYSIKSVEHTISENGWVSSLEFEL